MECALAKPDEGVSHMSNASPMTAYRPYSVARVNIGGYSHYQKRSATPRAAITVCIVNDNRVACDALASMLEQVPDMRPVARTEADPALLADANAQVLVLDAELQESVQHVVALKSAHPDAKVVVMDLGPSLGDISEFVKAGASGFILKDADFDEFVGTIREVAAGKTVFPARVTDSLLSRMTREAGGSREKRLARKACMTPREHDVSDLIGAGLSNGEIARRLGVSCDTVKSHVRNIMAKLALHSRLQIAAYTSEQHTT
jgi:DNA-binding NarL/FixJ family response regulator